MNRFGVMVFSFVIGLEVLNARPVRGQTEDNATINAIKSLGDSLVRVGIPDPVGLSYKSVRIRIPGEYHEAGLPTVGWISQDAKQAIAWDGASYELVIGNGKTDLESHPKQLVSRWERIEDVSGHRPLFQGTSKHVRNEEEHRLPFDYLHPIQAVYLARLGRHELAVRVWNQCQRLGTVPDVSDPTAFLRIAASWTRNRYIRLTLLHERAFHNEALALGTALRAIIDHCQTICRDQFGIAKEDVERHLGFASQLDVLIAEQKRRLRPGYREVTEDHGRIDEAERDIHFLISMLENWHWTSDLWNEPFGMPFDPLPNDALINAIVAHPDCVTALFDCIESNTALSRYRGNQMYVSYSMWFLLVNELAYAILRGIWEMDGEADAVQVKVESGIFVQDSAEERLATAQFKPGELARLVNSKWAKYKSTGGVKFWHDMLANDDVDPYEWLYAAQKVSQPRYERLVHWVWDNHRTIRRYRPPVRIVKTYDMLPAMRRPKPKYDVASGVLRRLSQHHAQSSTRPQTGDVDSLHPYFCHGESLREKVDPPIDVLIRERIDALPQEFKDQYEILEYGTQLDICLQRWTGIKIADAHQRMLDRIADFPDSLDEDGLRDNVFRSTIETFEMQLGRERDGAKAEFTDWLRSLSIDDLTKYSNRILGVIAKYTFDEEMQALIEWLFSENKAYRDRMLDPQYVELQRFIVSPLLRIPSFHTLVVQILNDKRYQGRWDSLGQQPYWLPKDEWVGPEIDLNNQFRAEDPLTVRQCDFWCHRLTKILPLKKDDWENWVTEDDRQIERVKAFLERYGHRVSSNPAAYPIWNDRHPRSIEIPSHVTYQGSPRVFEFPSRDVPATAEDVAEGRAIFSLSPELPRRVPTGYEIPFEIQYDPTGKSIDQSNQLEPTEITPDKTYVPYRRIPTPRGLFADDNPFMTVTCWQVEEVLHDGQWHRYFGIISNEGISRVPSSEVFHLDESWTHLSHNLDCRLLTEGDPIVVRDPQKRDEGNVKPLQLSLQIRNRSSINLTLPVVADDVTHQVACKGITLNVARVQAWRTLWRHGMNWQRLPLFKHRVIEPSRANGWIDFQNEFRLIRLLRV